MTSYLIFVAGIGLVLTDHPSNFVIWYKYLFSIRPLAVTRAAILRSPLIISGSPIVTGRSSARWKVVLYQIFN